MKKIFLNKFLLPNYFTDSGLRRIHLRMDCNIAAHAKSSHLLLQVYGLEFCFMMQLLLKLELDAKLANDIYSNYLYLDVDS